MQLITFDENKNIKYNDKYLNDLLTNHTSITDLKYKVVSVFGQSRIGKSTLLNILISHHNNLDKEYFKTSHGSKHCSKGVSIYISNNIIFLDFAGILFENSDNDINLLLLAYMLSDIIIYNDNNLNNATLKAFESFILYSDNIIQNITSKPKLLFRIKDYSLDEPINELLLNTMLLQNDHFDNIRIALSKLFLNISAIDTEIPSYDDFLLLRNHRYLDFINQEEVKFREVIKYVDNTLKDVKSTSIILFIQKFKYIINKVSKIKINNNDLDFCQIKFQKLFDIFISNIDHIMTTEINFHDGSQSDFINIIEPRINSYNDIIKSFNEQFKLINNDFRNICYEVIKSKYYIHIENAIDKCTNYSISKINDFYYSLNISINNNCKNMTDINFINAIILDFLNNESSDINIYFNKWTEYDNNLNNSHITSYKIIQNIINALEYLLNNDNIDNFINTLYKPIYDIFIDLLTSQINYFKKSLNELIQYNILQINFILEQHNDDINNLFNIDKIIEYMDLVNIPIDQSIEQYFNDLYKDNISEILISNFNKIFINTIANITINNDEFLINYFNFKQTNFKFRDYKPFLDKYDNLIVNKIIHIIKPTYELIKTNKIIDFLKNNNSYPNKYLYDNNKYINFVELKFEPFIDEEYINNKINYLITFGETILSGTYTQQQFETLFYFNDKINYNLFFKIFNYSNNNQITTIYITDDTVERILLIDRLINLIMNLKYDL